MSAITIGFHRFEAIQRGKNNWCSWGAEEVDGEPCTEIAAVVVTDTTDGERSYFCAECYENRYTPLMYAPPKRIVIPTIEELRDGTPISGSKQEPSK